MSIRTALTLGACLTAASFGVSAHSVSVDGEVEAVGDGYINVGGNVLKTGRGECFETSALGDDNLINKCAGIEEEVEEEVVAEAVEPEPVEEVQAAPEPPAPVATIDTREFSEKTLFDTNSAALNPEGEIAMNGLFDALKEFKGITGVNVTGHTDSRGSESYNQALSEQRAATVAALISEQYPDAALQVSGAGESQPAASNVTPEGRQQNRRVEVEITATRMTFN